MADVFEKDKRSEIMSHIRSRNTKPEVALRKALFALGFRFRINDKRLAGKPDIVLPKYHTVVFVHGCFWHGHDRCKYAYKPKTNSDFWETKIQRNKERDERVKTSLELEGWRVLVVWECEIKTKDGLSNITEQISTILKKQG